MTDATLKRLLPRDAENLFTLVDRNRQRLHKFWWEAGTRAVADSLSYIMSANEAEYHDEPGGITRGIFVDDTLAGVAGIHTIDWSSGSAVVGIWIGEAYDGQGYATDAVRHLCQIAFKELQLDELTITPRVKNVASRRMAEKSGFVLSGIDSNPAWHVEAGEDVPEVAHYRLTSAMYDDATG